jgi:hypothetical protein
MLVWNYIAKVSFPISLAVFQASGAAHMKLHLAGTVNRLNVEHRTSNVQYWWRYALSILKQAKSRISKGRFARAALLARRLPVGLQAGGAGACAACCSVIF